jgi:hypothetical protein
VEILGDHRAASSGSVRVLGMDPAAGGRRRREWVGIVLQSGGIGADGARYIPQLTDRPLTTGTCWHPAVTKDPAQFPTGRSSIETMDRSAEPARGAQHPAALEDRMRQLEAEMEALIEAVEVLTRGLEGGPIGEPRNKGTEEAARRAHELLLLAKSKAAGSTAV